jgi:lipid A disaccharide synthetase
MIEQLIRLEFRLTALRLKGLAEMHEEGFKEAYEATEITLEKYMDKLVRISKLKTMIDETIRVSEEMPLVSVLQGLNMFKEGLKEYED